MRRREGAEGGTDGGGVAIEDGSAFFTAGSSVSRNEALSRGGGLCVDSASVALSRT